MTWDCRRCTENFRLGIGEDAAASSYAVTGYGKLPGVHAGGNGRDCSNGSLQKAKTRL
ncbi:hypothetical protein [Salmonella enterica]|uniref:hypothetical protein n=1 Tax=Salmonella enterica TaxID=28901 RepID=UPI0012FE19EB|nr:hypothetical protein [Salmonella enterica]